MDSIVSKLTEIESAAEAIVRHAEAQKNTLDEEFEKKRRDFDEELERKTRERIQTIQDELEKNTQSLLDSQSGKNTAAIEALRQEYEEKHTQYAKAILQRITEV